MLLKLLALLPRNVLSRWVGLFYGISWPRPINGLVNRLFGSLFGINFSEAEKPASEYASFNEFFTRKLKDGLRPIADSQIVHPADSQIVQEGKIQRGKLIQAKDIDYPLSELLQSEELAQKFQEGYFVTYYLSPKDYHRVHSPVDAELACAFHIPGSLWPVNQGAMQGIPKLYCLNERVIIELKSALGTVVLVMVGATNVGKMTMAFDPSIVSNQADTQETKTKKYLPRLPIRRGQELGTFNLGSTVVVLFDKDIVNQLAGFSKLASQRLAEAELSLGKKVQMGQGLF